MHASYHDTKIDHDDIKMHLLICLSGQNNVMLSNGWDVCILNINMNITEHGFSFSFKIQRNFI